MISFGESIISLLLLCREGVFGRIFWGGIWVDGVERGGRSVV